MKEMQLEGYRLVTMPFPPRFLAKDFLQLNRLGTIPYMVDSDSDDPSAGMTESCAAPVYLAEKFGSPDPEAELVVRPSEPGYSQYLNWLFHADATLTFPQTILLRYREQEPDKGLQTAGEDYGKWYIARLRMLDATLEDGREFLVADRFTLADICITYALFLGTTLGLDERYKPQTKAYLERMMVRPAFQAAREEEAASLKAFEAGNAML